MGKAEELTLQALSEARLVDAVTAEFADSLGRVLGQLNRSIRGLLDELETRGGRLVATRASLGRSLQLRAQLLDVLERSGYREVVAAALDEPLDRLATEVLTGQGIANRAARLTSVQLDAITAFKEVRLAALLDVADDAINTLVQTVMDGVIGGRPVTELVDDLALVLDRSSRQARTIYDTAVSTFSRQVEQLAGGPPGPGDLFFYTGPVDAKTRPFCRDLAGRVLKRRQIDDLRNGQIGNVMVTGGGFNCRHAFKRVSVLDRELRELAQTGDRYAPIQRRVDRVTA